MGKNVKNKPSPSNRKKHPKEDIVGNRAAGKQKYKGSAPSQIAGRRYSFTGNQFGERGATIVTDAIVLGSATDANNIEFLKKIGVSHILNAARGLINSHPKDFIYHNLDLEDNVQANLGPCRDEVNKFLGSVEKCKGRALVHCKSGVSRSVACVIMYLMSAHRLRLRDIFNYISSIRPFISVNEGFRLQLANIELEIFGDSSVATDESKAWNFYEWNSKKRGVRTDAGKQSCCSIL